MAERGVVRTYNNNLNFTVNRKKNVNIHIFIYANEFDREFRVPSSEDISNQSFIRSYADTFSFSALLNFGSVQNSTKVSC